jgi:CubicO group peptidase (beta-lactamase class C family)
MNTFQSKPSAFILFLFVGLFSCNNGNVFVPDTGYEYRVPEQIDDGWEVSSLDAVGMDTEMITSLTNQIINGQFKGIHSMIVVKNGILVHEVYFGGYTRSSLQTMYSITKSVSSALIGIAIDQGFIQGVDEQVLSFFPEYEIVELEEQVINLEHLLTLTSGLEWDETSYPYSDPRNSEYQMVASDDWIRYVLERPMKDEPGTRFVYNTGSVHLISGIIRNTSGMFTNVFAEKYLFQHLSISEYEWNTDPQGHPCTGGTNQGLRLKARDVAKFGYLFMHEGKWKDKQLVPETWIQESTQKHVDLDNGRGLGYLWWTGAFIFGGRRIDHFYATGYGGQSLHIVPELDLMIVLLCWDQAQDADIFGPMFMIYEAALLKKV